MKQTDLFTRLYIGSEWIAKIVYINLLWIVFTLAGLIIFGIFPSTIALLMCFKNWLSKDTDENDFPIFKTFLKNYKDEFFKSNKVGIVFIIIGFILCVDIVYIAQFHSELMKALTIVFISISIVYLYALIYSLVIYVNVTASVKLILKKSLLYSAAHPYRGLLIVCLIIGLLILSLYFPVAILLFSFSLAGFFMIKFSNPIFNM